MSFSRQGIPAPQTGPGPQLTYAELIDEYPELADQVGALVSPLDVGSTDGHGKAFDRQYPSLMPYVRRPW